jgi:hypothetical protein
MGRVKCRNPGLGLATKARTCKSADQEWSPGVAFHAPRRLKIWENVRIEPPHSQVNSHFGSWNPNGPPNLQGAIAGVKIHWIEKFFTSLESSWYLDVKNGLAWPIWNLKHKLWPKERLGVKLTIWLSTIKSWESLRFLCVHVACDIPLESSRRGL